MLLRIYNVTFGLIVLLVSCYFVGSEELDFEYHSNEELENILKNFSHNGDSPLRKTLYSIGNSSGRPKSGIIPSPIWVLEITAAEKERFGVPNVKLVGNVHGTETAGREILLHFIEYLIQNYGTDELVTWLLNNTRIHILPCLNPDGFAVATQFICNGCGSCLGIGVTDDDTAITSNFPDYFHTNEVLQHATETLAIMKWTEDVKFILSGSFFGSFVVAIYPYCNKNETHVENPTPDDDVFQHLAKTYANNHPEMYKGNNCPHSSLIFNGGIINGASWHNHDADMTDYNYIFRGCMEVRLEISCCKYPATEDLRGIWNDNRNALLQYVMQANRGVTGRVLDFETKRPIEATMKIVGRDMEFRSFQKTGEYWRILLPGKYQLQIEADGYYTQIQPFVVKDYGKKFPQLTNLNVLLLNSSVSTTTTSTTPKSTTTRKTRKTTVSKTVQQRLVTDVVDEKCLGNHLKQNLLLMFSLLIIVRTI